MSDINQHGDYHENEPSKLPSDSGSQAFTPEDDCSPRPACTPSNPDEMASASAGDAPNPNDDLIIFIDQSRRQLVRWLSANFPSASAEDILQNCLLELWRKGPSILGLALPSPPSGACMSETSNREQSFKRTLLSRFQHHLYCRAIDNFRRSNSITRGGGSVHVDIEVLRDTIAAPGQNISLTECSEAIGGLRDWLSEDLSERERLVAKIYLGLLPVRPTVEEIYEELGPHELDEFLPRNGRKLLGEAARNAIKGQISRTRASLEDKFRGFGGTQ